LRQAYDYWQDQPGNFFVNTRRRRRQPRAEAQEEAATTSAHTKGSKSSQGVY